DLPRLPYARMIIDETLRLYPPIWLLMRNTVQDDRIGTYDVPAKTLILFSPYILHRHPDFWEEPEHFDPERFTPERLAKLPRGSYIPFGHGPHLCIGQGFALQEMVLMLALIAQRYRLILAPDHRVEPLPLISLHIRHGLPMHLHPR
ncbi:MAG: cytochrome P450, partial [Ktedonobacteraceae bacterium]|nr:cytochrome P450 [Ktedonobacteraceae bacterium]